MTRDRLVVLVLAGLVFCCVSRAVHFASSVGDFDDDDSWDDDDIDRQRVLELTRKHFAHPPAKPQRPPSPSVSDEDETTLALLAAAIARRSPYDTTFDMSGDDLLRSAATSGLHGRMNKLFAGRLSLSDAAQARLADLCYGRGVLLFPLADERWPAELVRGPASYFGFSTRDRDTAQLYVVVSTGSPYLQFIRAA